MTVRTWPASLPPPERRTWRQQPQDARIRRQPEAGPPGYRRRFSSVARGVTLSVLLSRADRAVFDQFYEETCRWGADHFRMADPTTDGWALLGTDGGPLLAPDGTPLVLAASWLCAWGEGVPAETLVGLEFRKTFSVWVLP